MDATIITWKVCEAAEGVVIVQIIVVCPTCRQYGRVSRKAAGHHVRCPSCGAGFVATAAPPPRPSEPDPRGRLVPGWLKTLLLMGVGLIAFLLAVAWLRAVNDGADVSLRIIGLGLALTGPFVLLAWAVLCWLEPTKNVTGASPSAPDRLEHTPGRDASRKPRPDASPIPRYTEDGAFVRCPHCERLRLLARAEFCRAIRCGQCGKDFQAVPGSSPDQIPFSCWKCACEMELGQHWAGKYVDCIDCRARVRVPVESIRVLKVEAKTNLTGEVVSPSAARAGDGSVAVDPALEAELLRARIELATGLLKGAWNIGTWAFGQYKARRRRE